MKKVGILITIIAIVGQLYFPLVNYTESFKIEGKEVDLPKNREKPKNRSKATFKGYSDNSVKNQTFKLNFSNLSSYLLDHQFPDGGFQIKKGTQSYMNSTYFASLALSLTGKTTSMVKDGVSYFLNHTFVSKSGETFGGFKNWLEGNVTLRSTAFAMLTLNQLNLRINTTNNSSFNYLANKLSTLDPQNIPLLELALASLALKSSSQKIRLNSSIVTSIKTRLDWNNNGNDGKENQEKMVESYFSTFLLTQLNNLSVERKNSIKQSLLSAKYNSSYGGFGWDSTNPTVFQTGLAVETLVLVNGSINSTIKDSVLKFVNSSQQIGGGITLTPQKEEKNIFQSVGAILCYHATQELINTYSSSIASPSKQVVKGKDIRIAIPVKFRESNLVGLSVRSTLLNIETQTIEDRSELPFNFTTGVYEVEISHEVLSFGPYKIKSSITFNWTGIPQFQKNLTFFFRVGFQIKSSTPFSPSPGTTAQINFTIEGDSQYLDVNGTLQYTITNVHSSRTVVEGNKTSNYSSPFYINWSIPPNASLGYYRIKADLADTYGTNHSMNETTVRVWDTINVEVDKEEKATYKIGEQLYIRSIFLQYNHSGSFPHQVPSKAKFEWIRPLGIPPYPSYPWKGFPVNVSNGSSLNLTVPQTLPNRSRIQVSLQLKFGQLSISHDLFRFNLTLTGFELANFSIGRRENQNSVLIGEKVNATFGIKENITQSPLLEAKVRIDFKWQTTVVQRSQAIYSEGFYTFNETLNPNLPSRNSTMEILVQIPWNESFVRTQEVKVNIKGTPYIKSVERRENTLDQVSFIRFQVVRNESEKGLNGLNLSANVSYQQNVSVPIGIERNGYYSVSFTPQQTGEYKIKIFRVIDSLQLGTIKVTVKEKQQELFGQWRQKLLSGILFSIIAFYFIVRWKVGKEVSRRWLIEKWREREKKKK